MTFRQPPPSRPFRQFPSSSPAPSKLRNIIAKYDYYESRRQRTAGRASYNTEQRQPRRASKILNGQQFLSNTVFFETKNRIRAISCRENGKKYRHFTRVVRCFRIRAVKHERTYLICSTISPIVPNFKPNVPWDARRTTNRRNGRINVAATLTN